jgi:hypothetical protein
MNHHTPDGLADAYADMRTVEIPDHWSSEQALAVWELLNEVANRIWARYQRPMVELIRADLEHDHDEHQLDLFDPDDIIPF